MNKNNWLSCSRRYLSKTLAVLTCSLALLAPATSYAQFVKTDGTDIVSPDGQPLYLSGINLGNWLLWEGYLMMGDFNYRTHTQFLNSLAQAFGSMEKAREFEHEWRLNYVEENAITDLKALGFNTVRVPFHYNMFWQNGALSNHGFQYFDALLEYCRDQGIYVLLDMHAAPGYQNPGDHADNMNSNASQPRDSVTFWDGNNIDTAAKVWRHIANYYKDEPMIIGYDLINEPVPQPGRELELLGSLVQLRNAIREVDTNHMIVAEGSWWGSDLTKIDWHDPLVQAASGISEKWDHNLVYQIHHYGHVSSTLGRDDITNRLGVPLIIGEFGESDENNLKAITDWAKSNLAGYYPWSFKKMSHDKTLWSIPTNTDYERVKQFINSGGTPPTDAFGAMLSFARTNIVNGHASHTWHNGFYQAVKPGVGTGPNPDPDPTPEPEPSCEGATYTTLPGRLEAEDYCASFGIQTEPTGDVDGAFNIGWVDSGDWLEYNITLADSGEFDVSLRAAVNDQQGAAQIIVDGESVATLSLPVTGDWQLYKTSTTRLALDAGNHRLKIQFSTPGINLNWISVGAPTDNPPEPSPCDNQVTAVPAQLQAEHYCEMQGIKTEATSDTGGGLNVGWIDAGDWLKFGKISVVETAQFVVNFRVASASGGGRINLNVDGDNVGGVDVPATGGWQSWRTLKLNTTLASGQYELALEFASGGVNVNWLEFSVQNTVPVTDLAPGNYVIINQASGRALDVENVSTANGANVQQWDYQGGLNQHWIAQSQGDNRFELISENSGACLDADSGSANVHQWQCHGNANQIWTVEAQADGSFVIRTGDGTEVLSLNNGNTANGVSVHTRPYSSAADQRWRFQTLAN